MNFAGASCFEYDDETTEPYIFGRNHCGDSSHAGSESLLRLAKRPREKSPNLYPSLVSRPEASFPRATTPKENFRTSKRRSIKSRYSFNIFDGTNSSGKFACFIFAGDSEDEREDNRETERWNEVQDHI
jgi:hypothetical protein